MIVRKLDRIKKFLIGPGINSDQEFAYVDGKVRLQILSTHNHGLSFQFFCGVHPVAIVSISGEEADNTLWYVLDAGLRGKAVFRKLKYRPLVPVSGEGEHYSGYVEGPLTGTELAFNSDIFPRDGDFTISATLRLRDTRYRGGERRDFTVTLPLRILSAVGELDLMS